MAIIIPMPKTEEPDDDLTAINRWLDLADQMLAARAEQDAIKREINPQIENYRRLKRSRKNSKTG